jgi:uncharacterized protein
MKSLLLRSTVVLLVLSAVVAPSPRVSAQEETTAPGVAGNTYTSPSYGFALTWGEEWRVVESVSQGGYDLLHLSNGVSDVYLEGYVGFGGDPVACREDVRSQLEAEEEGNQLSVAEGDDGAPLEGTDATGAYAVYDVTVAGDSGSSVDLAVYVDCRTLVPGGAVLAITQVAAADDYNDQIDPVDQLIAKLVMPANTGALDSTADVEALMRATEEDLTAYWTEAFAAQGQTYAPPAYVTFDAPIETACGDVAPGEAGPFYCPDDRTIYLDLKAIADDILPYGPFVVAYTIAHETGHHVQELLGLPGCGGEGCGARGQSLAIELQADCFGGAWAKDAKTRGRVEAGDVEDAIVALADFFGDPPNTPATDPDAHGEGSLRTWWFLKGYYDGAQACTAKDTGEGADG